MTSQRPQNPSPPSAETQEISPEQKRSQKEKKLFGKNRLKPIVLELFNNTPNKSTSGHGSTTKFQH